MKSGYDRDGYAVVRDLVSPGTVAAALAHLATLPGDGPLRTAPIETDRFFTHLVGIVALEELAAEVLDDDVEAFGCTYLVKPARTGLPVLWHQDGHPWAERGITRAVTIGIALEATTPDNGCLRVLPGSHRVDATPLRPVLDPPNVFGAETDPALVDDTGAVAVPLEPGDASIHHPNLIHGSEPNRSASPRTMLVVRYRALGTF